MKKTIVLLLLVGAAAFAVLPQAQAWPNGRLTNTKNTTTQTIGYCIVTTNNYTNWVYTDTKNTGHSFPAQSQVVTARSTNPKFNCSAYNDVVDVQVWSSDGKGYYLTTMNGSFGTVTITAYLEPKYQILTVLADAPGNMSSNCFTNSTFYGTTDSVSNSFTNTTSVTFSQSQSLFGVIGDNTSETISFSLGYGTTDSFTTTFTNAQGVCNDSTHNPLDHSQDMFWIWLNPMVTLTQTGASAVSYAVSPPPSQSVYAVRVSAAGLQNPSSIDVHLLEPMTYNGVTYPGLSNICAHPLPPSQCTQANACGCVPQDFAAIVALDPLLSLPVNSTETPDQIDSKRYFVLNPPPSPLLILEGPTTQGGNEYPVTFSVTDQNQSAHTGTETIGTSIGFTYGYNVTTSAAPVDFTVGFSVTNTLSYSHSTSLTKFTGSSHNMSVTLGTSTFGCDEGVEVYEDYLYHTFVLVPSSTPPTACDSN